MAPSSSARNVVSPPRSVSDDTITTGIGRSRMSFSRKSSPSIRGISTSSVRTSGLCCLISSRATSGSGATATTSISAWLLMISVIKPRTSAESSTQRTRILLIIAASLLPGSAHALVHGLPPQAEIPADVREVFRVPGEQQPPVFQQRDKPLQDARLGGFIEIDHDVAAENRIKALTDRPDRRQQIQRLEPHHPGQFRAHAHLPFVGPASTQKES